MNKLSKFFNTLNDWGDIIMGEKKRDLKEIIAAGKKVFAKLKDHADGKIMSYDGDDCYYSDIDDFEITPEGFSNPEVTNNHKVKNTFKDIVSGFTPKKEEERQGTADDSSSDEDGGEKAFKYYEQIMHKLDGIKDKSADGLDELVKKAERLFKNSSLTKEELASEIDSLMVELDDKLSVILSKSTQTSETVENISAQSKSNFEKLSGAIADVSDKTDNVFKNVTDVESILNSSQPKFDEIHEASVMMSKLVDSVFEIKRANANINAEMDAINRKQRFIKVWGIIVGSVVGACAIAALVLQIISFAL